VLKARFDEHASISSSRGASFVYPIIMLLQLVDSFRIWRCLFAKAGVVCLFVCQSWRCLFVKAGVVSLFCGLFITGTGTKVSQ
jgi:hypothetical protein